MKIFINYRRGDAGGWAKALHSDLASRFGPENVFLDVVTLQPGTKWLQEIQSHGSSSAVFISLIGSQWAEIMRTRSRQPDEDQVRNEIQLAFSLGATVIPALVGDATMPRADEVPRDLAPLLTREKVDLRPGRWDADVAHLIDVLERPESGPADEPEPVGEPAEGAAGGDAQPVDHPKPEVDVDPRLREHFDFLVARVLDGEVVPFLGPGANSSARDEPWRDNAAFLPDAHELAAYLAQKYQVEPEFPNLAEVAQYVSLARASSLYKTVTKTLTMKPHIAPTPVHQFLAGLPTRLAQLGVPEANRYPQLVITTNYDDALERAFDDADPPTPYDLAIYMASGPDRGHFVHLPYEGEPSPVRDGATYDRFPIDQFGDLTRTVIVKIHGGVDRRVGPYPWQENYVLTEDDYIDYLSARPVSQIVPAQILGKLRQSHLLFLGYTMRDWNLRVFLQRIFGHQLNNECWAVQPDSDDFDANFWDRIAVRLITTPLTDYVRQLDAHLASTAAAGVQ